MAIPRGTHKLVQNSQDVRGYEYVRGLWQKASVPLCLGTSLDSLGLWLGRDLVFKEMFGFEEEKVKYW